MLKEAAIKPYSKLIKGISIISIGILSTTSTGWSDLYQWQYPLSVPANNNGVKTPWKIENNTINQRSPLMHNLSSAINRSSIQKSFASDMSALTKARIFNPTASLPYDSILKEKGYLEIAVFDNAQDAHAVQQWFSAMLMHGIAVRQTFYNGRYTLLLRFSNPDETMKIYDLLYSQISKATNLDREIIKHVIFKESRGKEAAVSSAGAGGITQTLPVVIKDLLKEKQKAGNKEQSKKQIVYLEKEIKELADAAQEERTPVLRRELQKELARKKYIMTRLEIMTALPDYVISSLSFANRQIELDEKLTKKLKIKNGTLSRVEYLALLHGPLNLCFGMAHLALQYNTFEYYKAIGKIDTDTEPLLASQLAYNCGQTRTIKKIESLGGWSKIFDIPVKRNGEQPAYLPNETADYGYQFIKSYLHHMTKQSKHYLVHPNKKLHYKMCLSALKRSNTFQTIIKTFEKKGFHKKRNMLMLELNLLITQANAGKINVTDLEAFQDTINTLPCWPLIREMQHYLDTVITNSCLPANTQPLKKESAEIMTFKKLFTQIEKA
ncbi:MAG: transglycosylase SLT domain-containing protein [Candidatus Omnitrophica bacterium]|nr:transglycosylase SLT domain-containing protein [Candidatus Omnitrophota bacterium]